MSSREPVGVLASGAATGVGSLPHLDPERAAACSCALHPLLPAAPQLPARSAREGMLAQAADGVAGVTVDATGRLVVPDPDRLDPTAPVDVTFGPDSWAGLLAFLAAVEGRTEPVKVQLTGPVTFGVALMHAGVAADVAVAVGAAAVQARATALLERVARAAPDAPVLAVLDEPGLTACHHPGFPIGVDETTDLVSSALATLATGGAVTGVHCCGPTDWRLPIDAGAQVLSLPTGPELLDQAGSLAHHLDRGGWIAWGAIPTTGPLGADADLQWRRLTALWCDLSRLGCDPGLLRRQALLTPACGLAGHGESQAELVLRLAAVLGDRVQDQALASRLSAGA